MDGTYRFLVRGHLDERRSGWLGGLRIHHTADGCSVLTGSVTDQAALHGVIARIRDMGLPLLAMECASAGWKPSDGNPLLGTRGSPAQPCDAFEDPNSAHGIAHRLTTIEGDTL